MRETTIPSRYWRETVNSLGVTHLERRWSLVHYPVFCLFCTLSSYAVTFLLLLFIPPNLTFLLRLSVSPLIKKLDGGDVSLWPLLGLCSFPSCCLGKNPTNLMLALEPALSLFLTLSSSHRNSIVSPLPADLISPHPYKVSLSSFFTIQAKLMPWKIQVPHTFQKFGMLPHCKTGKICSPFPGKYMMKTSSMEQETRASVPDILLIVAECEQLLLFSGRCNLRPSHNQEKLKEQDVLELLKCVIER